MIATLAACGSALLGEAPRVLRFGGATPALHFTDLLAGTVHRLVGAQTPVVAEYPGETVSALIPLRDGGSAVALRRSVAILDASGVERRRIPLDLPAGTRLSDGTAGPSGHLWLGVVAAESDPIPGMLLRVGDDGVQVARVGIGFANGIGFTADGTRMLLIDSTAGTISASMHDPRTGGLGDGRVLYLHDGPGALDGLCLDARDRAWIAVFGGGEVFGLDLDGDVVGRIEVPARRVTSCVVVGNDLHITTARVDAPPAELAEFPQSGSLFRADVSVGAGTVWEGQLA